MSRVFFTSDLHFGHTNLCRHIRNMSAEESDELIIRNWNKKVTKRDIVYMNGDFTMEKPAIISKYVKQLHGEIRIIGGNHDTVPCCKEFLRLGIQVVGNIEYKGFLLSHVPLHPREVDFFLGNIHGHIHDKTVDLGYKYINVNTEFHNYTPVLFDDLFGAYLEKNINYFDNNTII